MFAKEGYKIQLAQLNSTAPKACLGATVARVSSRKFTELVECAGIKNFGAHSHHSLYGLGLYMHGLTF